VITLQIADPSSRQSGRPKDTRPQISDSNFRQEVMSGRKSYKGALYQDILTDWLTDSQSWSSFDFDNWNLHVTNRNIKQNKPAIHIRQWSSTWGTRTTEGMRTLLNEHGNTSYGIALTLNLPGCTHSTEIRPRNEMLTCQKQAHSSQQQVRSTLIIDQIFNHIILLCENAFVPLLIVIWYFIPYFGCNVFNRLRYML
jgi:hypothetical protein